MKISERLLEILGMNTDISTLIYDFTSSANIRLDRSNFPAAVFYVVPSWRIDMSSGIKREKADVNIFICKKMPLDAKGEDVDTIVKTIEPIAYGVISQIENDDLISINKNVTLRMSYAKYDVNVVGISIEATLDVKQGECFGTQPNHRQITITSNGQYDVGKYKKAIINVQ